MIIYFQSFGLIYYSFLLIMAANGVNADRLDLTKPLENDDPDLYAIIRKEKVFLHQLNFVSILVVVF